MTGKDKSEETNGSGIKVVDRRHFTAEGERRAEAPEESESEPTREPAREEPASEPGGFEHHPVNEPQGVDFTMLINAMAQPALFYLGEALPPGAEEPVVDLTRARLQIDMLDLLKVKCRGNLTEQEDGLLDRVLYQLRMLYVSRSGQPG